MRLIILLALVIFGCKSNNQSNQNELNHSEDSSITISQKEEKTKSPFIGKWIHEGEQSILLLEEDGNCSIAYFDEKKKEDVKINGKWKAENFRLNIHWEKEWLYGIEKESKYEYRKTDKQEILWYLYNPEDAKEFKSDGQFGFYKD